MGTYDRLTSLHPTGMLVGIALRYQSGVSDVQNSHIGVDSQCALIGAGHSAAALPLLTYDSPAQGAWLNIPAITR